MVSTAEDVHGQLSDIANSIEDAIDVAESYLQFVLQVLDEMQQDRPDDAKSRYVWEMQRDRLKQFIAHLSDDVWDQIRELIDRTAVMEIARKGEFV